MLNGIQWVLLAEDGLPYASYPQAHLLFLWMRVLSD